MKFNTIAVHAGQEADPATGAVIPPLYLATTFAQERQEPLRYFYGRGESPTREALETNLAALEGGGFALAFSSGQAAGAAALSLLRPGDQFLCSDDVYGGTLDLFQALAESSGLVFRAVDMCDLQALRAAFTDRTRLVWIETPTNPMLKLADIAEICAIARRRGVPVLVDNTFASPYLQRPMDLGADFVLYSTTKYLAGHGDVIGGALISRSEDHHRTLAKCRTVTGAIPGPLDCYLVHRGIKTLGLRVERQVANARVLVEQLQRSEKVSRVIYPGLASHPQSQLCSRQMAGPGAIISFEYLGDVTALMHRLEFFRCAVSLGAVFSLIECPAVMTHRAVPADKKSLLGITPGLVRLSVGIEDVADLSADLAAHL